ncbi:MAG: aconitate hydratase [Deltaproteobacteria bacterium]|nr:aconitate hydratase [Deltaproteobacteria bacterium]
MGQNIVQKVIAKHLVTGTLATGSEIGIRIDHTLIQDTTGVMAMLQFEALGIPRVKTKRSVAYVDHNILQLGFENMDDHRFLETASRKFGLHFSRAGNGICHQVNLERFSVPGDTLLGSDSHTTTAGGVGMLAMGAGGLDVAVAMGGVPFFLNMPKIVRVVLSGKLPGWSSAKDVALEILRRMTVSGGRGKILEFAGPGVQTLSVPQRATIANMSIETGAFTAVFPSDDETRRFFLAQQREKEWQELSADLDAGYEEEMGIDLSSIEPLMAKPHSPDNVVRVKAEEGRPVDQVVIGSCTNSSLADMLTVTLLLRGKIIPPGVSLVIAPGTRQVLRELTRRGALDEMIAAGARIAEVGCGFCVGIGQAPCSEGVSLRTANRNFPGRSGTENAQVYLVSPETAVASALRGKITDPRILGQAIQINLPTRLLVDDRMIIPPGKVGDASEVIRGPNIAPLPRFEPLPESLEGKILLSLGDNISTDDILPSGAQIMSLRSNIPAISRYIFCRIDPDFVNRVKAAGTGFVIAGQNYGQGSSREHAALVPRYLGLRAVIVKSYARIHKANLINFGILPLELVNEADQAFLKAGDSLRLSRLPDQIRKGGEILVENLTRERTVRTKLNISSYMREVIIAGGLLAYVGSRGHK